MGAGQECCRLQPRQIQVLAGLTLPCLLDLQEGRTVQIQSMASGPGQKAPHLTLSCLQGSPLLVLDT